MILTGSHDRSAYVWVSTDPAKWTKKLCVMARQTRAILAGAWSPDGKFWALSSGNHSVYFGYYDKEYDWWNSQEETYKASIMCMAFQPNPSEGNVLAIGLNEGTVRVVKLTAAGDTSEIGRVNLGSWVEGVAWSPSGTFLVAASSLLLVLGFNRVFL